ncbi:hypothetical protein P43SY_010792 [Pythium insidiosum]|uniref:Uncharacterized protein n=1 Tax=Pythium insidiosum TaxID=114742 RepID=A0AAD5Q1E4_PYTIN|nr:hypothetical protein P43SY_010792 [Pythium insidiosum]
MNAMYVLNRTFDVDPQIFNFLSGGPGIWEERGKSLLRDEALVCCLNQINDFLVNGFIGNTKAHVIRRGAWCSGSNEIDKAEVIAEVAR